MTADAAARTPLSRDRVLQAAITLADDGGIGAVTMRRLAEVLGAEAMSLYYHVANKEDVLDGVADAVVAEINDVVAGIPAGPSWKATARTRVLAARTVLLRHPWAPRVLESRTVTSGSVLVYYDGLVALMRSGGFTYDQAHHALHALGSRALGFSQELFDPGATPPGPEAAAEMALVAERLPHLAAMVADAVHDRPDTTLGWCDDQAEFEFGLDLLLDGLDRLQH